MLGQALEALVAERQAVREVLPLPVTPGASERRNTEIVSLIRLHDDECSLAQHVLRQLQAVSGLADWQDWQEKAGSLRSAATAGLNDEQHQAVLTALTSPLSVLTGGPGCGKTHTLRTLVDILEGEGASIALAAPTGKAAKRLEDSTGHPAQTVHRLLHPPEGDSLFDHESPLTTADMVIVDEASMLDVQLAAKLFRAVRTGCHLLLVGDIDQLPSVGPGRVLRDLLAVAAVPRTRLVQVYRQLDGSSAIVDAAHCILAGRMPAPHPNVVRLDLVDNPATDARLLAEEVVDLVARRIPKALAINPHEVQVLCPGKRHPAGATDLNLRLQAELNPAHPDKPEHHAEGRIYRLGDRVLQTRNRPRRGLNGIFNGATGTITAVNRETSEVTVTFEPDNEAIDYPFLDVAEELLHNYAMTVHRSQGSEYPYVIIPMTCSQSLLLQRNLLYTAVTRAQRAVLIIGHRKAVERALGNTEVRWRRTALETRLSDPGAVPSPPRPRRADGQLAWD
ncbi:ATP-dependent RecD-like DNA helicase [Streptomyces sp. Ac-502]|uniref:ATP-dependent DNA helicase n=1 Tax=Streptomyces sp. Ac-502 TaxID=3342801 RepID=UPI0038628FFD